MYNHSQPSGKYIAPITIQTVI